VVGISLRCRDQHIFDKACSLNTTTPPYTKDQTKYCSKCNKRFLSENCFQNHLMLKVKALFFSGNKYVEILITR